MHEDFGADRHLGLDVGPGLIVSRISACETGSSCSRPYALYIAPSYYIHCENTSAAGINSKLDYPYQIIL